MGSGFSETTLNHLFVSGCNAQYLNLAMSKMNQVQFSNCDLQFSSLNDCRLQNFALEHCTLVGADFSHTRLKGVDLRSSQISGLQLNLSDLQGAIVSSIQAMELLPLLGVIIEDLNDK